MSTNQLYAYDLTTEGDTLKGKNLGTLIPSAKGTDCRALCVGPTGQVWAAITEKSPLGIQLHHLVSFTPGKDQSPKDHGPVAIKNPNYTDFTDQSGKTLPGHHGQITLKDNTRTTRHVILGVCQGQDGAVYTLALQPYTLLKVGPDQLK